RPCSNYSTEVGHHSFPSSLLLCFRRVQQTAATATARRHLWDGGQGRGRVVFQLLAAGLTSLPFSWSHRHRVRSGQLSSTCPPARPPCVCVYSRDVRFSRCFGFGVLAVVFIQ
uniref:Uncharacterized protein n=1 Tax=Aegilops tauschii subsp. strangulata TaxID=200361 RepID=A0A453A6Q9_AEGTS